MEPRIEILPEKKIVGKRLMMSFSDNKTFELWNSFMPHRLEILNITGKELYSVEIYAPSYFDPFNQHKTFEKWAGVEVSDFDSVPPGMEVLAVPEGLYAVFIHRGRASDGPGTYRYIFGTWLPASPYVLDTRPHFAIMGEKYRNDDPDSEEELWIPIRQEI